VNSPHNPQYPPHNHQAAAPTSNKRQPFFRKLSGLITTSRVAKFGAYLLIGTVCVVNMQPWLQLGADFVNLIKVVPLFTLVGKIGAVLINTIALIPFLGAIIAALLSIIASAIGTILAIAGDFFWQIIGVLLWMGANVTQCGANLIVLFDIRDPWWVAQLSKWSSKWYRAVSYAIELSVNFTRYPPYEGGLKGVKADWPTLNFAAINWYNVVLAAVIIFSVEFAVYLFVDAKKLKKVEDVKFG
jgi:hypothetical protein